MSHREFFRNGRLISSVGEDQSSRALSELYEPLSVSTPSRERALRLNINAMSVGDVTVGYMQLNQAATVSTGDAQGFYVAIPVAGRALARAGGREPFLATPRVASVFMPGRSAAVQCQHPFQQIALRISRDRLMESLERALNRSCRIPLEFAPRMDMSAPTAQTLMATLHVIDAASENTGVLDHRLVSQNLEQLCVNALLFGHPHNYSAALRATGPESNRRPLDRAVELMREHPSHPWTITELAGEVSVSVRSLQEAFRRDLGTTPLRCLRDLRLDSARRELTDADPASVTVSHVAARWGFAHLGRFSTYYRERHGETPSETLRRGAG